MSSFISIANQSIAKDIFIYDTSDNILVKNEKFLNFILTDYEFDTEINNIKINIIDGYFMK